MLIRDNQIILFRGNCTIFPGYKITNWENELLIAREQNNISGQWNKSSMEQIIIRGIDIINPCNQLLCRVGLIEMIRKNEIIFSGNELLFRGNKIFSEGTTKQYFEKKMSFRCLWSSHARDITNTYCLPATGTYTNKYYCDPSPTINNPVNSI